MSVQENENNLNLSEETEAPAVAPVTDGEAENIDLLLEKADRDRASGDLRVSRSQDGCLEFEFGIGSATGFVFEEKPSPAPAPVPEKKPAPVKEPEPAPVEPPKEKPAPELYVPEKFTVNEKYNAVFPTDDTPRVRGTYVPRFTDASRNYRMSDDPRPRPAPAPTTPDVTVTEEETSAPVSEATAEITAEVPEQETVLVNVSHPVPEPEPEPILSGVYKFAVTEEAPAEEAEEPAEEPAPIEEPAAEPAPIEEPLPEEAPAPSNVRLIDHFYEPHKTIPDPVAVTVIDVSGDPVEELGPEVSISGGNVRHNEFLSLSQRESVKDRFLDRILSVKVRFLVAAALAFVLLIFENLFLFGVDMTSVLRVAEAPAAAALVDLQFLLCLFLLALPEFLSGVRLLKDKALKPELFLLPALLAEVGYVAALCALKPESYPFFGFIYAIDVLSAIGGTYFSESADFAAFRIASGSGEKVIVDNRLTRSLEKENYALDGAVDEYSSKIGRVFRTLFVADFFARSDRTTENSQNTLKILLIGFGASAVTGTVTFFLHGAVAAYGAALLVFLLSYPAFAALSHKAPYYAAQSEAVSDDCAVIGEASFDDFAPTDVLTFRDTEVFTPEDINLKRVMLYGERGNLTKAYRQMSALFRVAGGSLYEIFSGSLDVVPDAARDVRIEADGLSGRFDGLVIRAGSKDYMVRNGIAIPGEAEDTSFVLDSTKVMYAAEDGKIYAKFVIRYTFSEGFSALLPSLYSEKITPLVYTRDPNLSSELCRTLSAGKDGIRVLKMNTPAVADERVYRQASAGIVSRKDKNAAIGALLLTKRYHRFQRKLLVAEMIAMGVGIVAGVLASLLGGVLFLPSLLFGLPEAALCFALGLFCRSTFRSAPLPKADEEILPEVLHD